MSVRASRLLDGQPAEHPFHGIPRVRHVYWPNRAKHAEVCVGHPSFPGGRVNNLDLRAHEEQDAQLRRDKYEHLEWE